MENFDLPPMSPDELSILMGLAGPLFAESRNIEKMTSDNTVVGGHKEDGSMKIRLALEHAQQAVRAQAPPPPTPQIPKEFIDEVIRIDNIPRIEKDIDLMVQSIKEPSNIVNIPNTPPINQLEFNFNKNEQQITNDLLREIVKKLTKIETILNLEVESKLEPKKPQNVSSKKLSQI